MKTPTSTVASRDLQETLFKGIVAMTPVRTTLMVVIVYALAMAWVESAVVYYLRSMIDRIVPYQPNPLPRIGGFGLAEIIREAATMVMLATVGFLAGSTWRTRIAYSLVAFGVWDIAYYLWLIPLTGWPNSIANWDILFLIPLPWWGPVWAPVSIACLMIAFGALVIHNDTADHPVWPARQSLAALCVGVTLALYVFMADALQVVMTQGTTRLFDMLPVWFNWPLFLLALALMSVPIIDIRLRTRANARADSISVTTVQTSNQPAP